MGAAVRSPSPPGDHPPPRVPGRRRVVRGMQWFLGLTVLGFLVVFLQGRVGTNLEAVRGMALGYACLAALQSVFDVLAGGWRLQVLTRAFGARLRFRDAVVANGANIFLGGVTPSQTGGGPAQLVVMARAGVPLPEAMIASVVSFIGTVLSLLIAASVVTLTPATAGIPMGLRAFSGATVVLFLGVLLIFLAALPRGSRPHERLRNLVRRIPRVGPGWAASPRLDAFANTLGRFGPTVRQALRERRLQLLAGLLLSAVVYFNKFLIAGVVMQGLGNAVPWRTVLELQVLQYLVVYFAPTPGASGVAEFSASEIMAPLVPADERLAFVFLWRVFGLFLPMCIGGLLLGVDLLWRPAARSVSPGEPSGC